MAWRDWPGEYSLHLTDGYMGLSRAAEIQASGGAAEHRLACQVYRLATGPTELLASPNRIRRPFPLDVWVIGNHGWLQSAPAVIGTLSEDENRDDYRVLIVGLGPLREGGRHWYAQWPRWLRNAGMDRKKKHIDHQRFAAGADALLSTIAEQARDGNFVDTALNRMGLPHAFYGDSFIHPGAGSPGRA